MSIRLIIENEYKNAIKEKNTIEVNTLRLIKSAIKIIKNEKIPIENIHNERSKASFSISSI